MDLNLTQLQKKKWGPVLRVMLYMYVYFGFVKIIVLYVLSISYMMVDFIANHCSPKNGTFGTLEMLLTQEVDVIFGPVCSTGRL